jgi:hypothetical protein
MKRKPRAKTASGKPRSKLTAAEIYVEEYEAHARRVKPNIPYYRKPYYTGFTTEGAQQPNWVPIKKSETDAALPLLEHGIGCQTLTVPDGKPDEVKAENAVIFTPENNATSHEVLGIITYIDKMNLSSWGYPDGCTAIHLPDRSSNVLLPPFVIHRGRVGNSGGDTGPDTEHTSCMSGCMKPDENNFGGKMADVVFFSPGASLVEGVVVASKLSDTAEFFSVYDRIAGCTMAPPFPRLTARDMLIRKCYSELHVVAKFGKWGDSFDLMRYMLSQSHVSQAPFFFNQLEHLKVDPDVVIKSGEEFQRGTYGATTLFGDQSNRLIKRVTLMEFLMAVHKFNTIGIISFVVSDPCVLAQPKQIAKMALAFLRSWRTEATKIIPPPVPLIQSPPPPPPPPPPTPAREVYEVDTQPMDEQATQEIEQNDRGLVDAFIQKVCAEHHPTDAEGSAWNSSATPEDIGLLISSCASRRALSMASTWIMWRVMSGGVVSSTYNPSIIPISVNDVYNELMCVKHTTEIGDRLFQFILAGKLFHLLMEKQEEKVSESFDEDTHPPTE